MRLALFILFIFILSTCKSNDYKKYKISSIINTNEDFFFSNVFAHRGLSKSYPENTMIAFEKAYEQGFRVIELDVLFTKDGIPVIFHDSKVNRITNGKGYVDSFSLTELKTLNVKIKKNKVFNEIKIPTFEEYCQWASRSCFLCS